MDTRTLLSCVSLVAALWPIPAMAQSRVNIPEFTVGGSVPQICVLEAPQLAAGAMVNFRGINGNSLQIDQLIFPGTLATRAASASVEFAAVCTFPHRLRIESQNNGLWRTSELATTPAGGFAYAVPYRAEVTWGDNNRTLEADALSRRAVERRLSMVQATSGKINLRIVIDQGASNTQNNAPLIAGYYGDTLRIVVEPQ